jgi:Flp pilus assembly protein TadG
MRGGKTRRRRQDGAAAVEFALIVPVFLLLLFGIIAYGYMLSFRQSVSQAASEGARAAAVAPSSADRQAVAYTAIQNVLGSTCGSTYLTCSTATPASCSSCISVTVTYRYGDDPTKLSFPGIGIAMPDTLTFTSTVELSQ